MCILHPEERSCDHVLQGVAAAQCVEWCVPVLAALALALVQCDLFEGALSSALAALTILSEPGRCAVLLTCLGDSLKSCLAPWASWTGI